MYTGRCVQRRKIVEYSETGKRLWGPSIIACDWCHNFMNPARPQLVITFKFLKHLLFGILDLGFWDLGFLTFDIFDIFYI